MGPKYPECEIELTGIDANAYSIMGAVRRGLKRYLRTEGWDFKDIRTELEAYVEESTSGDYDNLLRTAFRWVTVN